MVDAEHQCIRYGTAREPCVRKWSIQQFPGLTQESAAAHYRCGNVFFLDLRKIPTQLLAQKFRTQRLHLEFRAPGADSGQQGMRWLDGITDSMAMSLSKLQKKDGGGWHAEIHEVTKSWTQLSN